MPIRLTDEDKLKLIEKEYFHLESEIELYDSKALTIKTWSVTVAAAIFGSSAIASEPVLFLAGTVASIMFLVIEASWKTFQAAHLTRIKEIEAAFRDEIELDYVLQISQSWKSTHNKFRAKGLFKRITWHHVWVPHIPLAVLFTAIYLFYYWGESI